MQLRHFTSTLDALNTQVAVITFVTGAYTQQWIEQTRSPFPMLADPTREVYRAYQLLSGEWRVWNPQMLWFYTKKVLRGWRLHGIQGDPHQLGGDFIIDPQGVIRLAYYSKLATKRPSVESLLHTLSAIHEGQA